MGRVARSVRLAEIMKVMFKLGATVSTTRFVLHEYSWIGRV
jgi:hypothetical protein